MTRMIKMNARFTRQQRRKFENNISININLEVIQIRLLDFF